MMRIFNIFFDKHAFVFEEFRGFDRGETVTFSDLLVVVRDAHSFSAAARRGFDHYGVAYFVGDGGGFVFGGYHAFESGNSINTRLLRNLLRRNLIPHLRNRISTRTDKNHPTLLHPPRKLRILTQETIPGMYRVRPDVSRRSDNITDIQVRFERRRGTDADGFIRVEHVTRAGVGGGVYGDGFYSEAAAGFRDAYGYFAAVGY
mmetsp:Transcript_48412/g.58603  ORF Transcript_48412/g.58603 Transcript_48412/m.58603 type:complete len:203 (+) Transcript_48412:460-1068(+)